MDWIENEYGTGDLGDNRLNKRAKKLLKRFGIGQWKAFRAVV